MAETVFRCAKCGEVMEGTAAFDPRPNCSVPSYMHPSCAVMVRAEMDADAKRVERAAPYLLAACEAAYEHATNDPIARLDQPQLLKLKKAIAMAKGTK